jgi:hypothetical protein
MPGYASTGAPSRDRRTAAAHHGLVARWVCPRCDREFGRARQAHVCVPGCTVEETFAGRPVAQREVYDAMYDHLVTLGPVHADAVQVGVFLKRERKLAEVRPRAGSLLLALILPRRVDSDRVTKVVRISGDRAVHFIPLTRADEVDDELRAWLTEAYDAAGDAPG